MSNLFLDDIRAPNDVKKAWHKGGWIEFPSILGWEIVRSYDQFVQFIEKNGLPKRISFDHDLSWEHYPKEGGPICEGDFRIGKITLPYENYKEKTGYHCAKWLTDYCWTKNLEFPDFFVHSMNPVGRVNIINCILRFKELQKFEKMFDKSSPVT